MKKSRLSEHARLSDYLWVLLFSAYSLLPVLWVVMTSLKTNQELVRMGPLALPQTLRFDNYLEAWNAARFSTYFVNSILIAVLTVGGIVLFSVLIAYSLCYLHYHGKKLVDALVIFGLLIPFELIMIPLFYNVKNMGIMNTHAAVILPQIALWLAFSVFLMKSFMRELPISLIESARIDGAGEYRTLFSIVTPMVKPAVISIIIFNLISSWNNFMLPTIMISSDKLRTVPLGLNAFRTKYSMDVALTAAAAVIIAAPVIVVYLIFQRRLITGLVVGAVKQ
ncbi:MAG TPA: carbohydrate ABC transporter permease [Candidatus Avichristensenella intestinipullorum]|uniref:Carbohydrate ABC transporter permease n=1 Tax=Candidatus Avichristensenella intestinipullorum TaxID=2840693 RepID=A0A9D0YYY0_9FIRM|nr:carbohydrate ABC transporter permease [Candidatus Avichristensenella intestinipullorum]